ncbi:MAG: transcriptional regulator, TetR family [Microbacteriaceae bacterium]|jgi:DNA-binding transcriptional regulator YbjK|nr:transcriptional regulator, TetR family [Microbacteriaceae bacterium]
MTANADGRLARGDLRRTLLLDAAVTVVAEHGSGALTHRAAAAAAGVSVASVTYHFPSIGDLREAMFDHAGSRIGLAFRSVVEAASASVEDVPEISASFAAHLVTERRADTSAVLEMIIAAGHDPNLRPLVRFFNDRLAEILGPYIGSRFRALTVAAAIQGLILGYIAQSDSDAPQALHDAVVDLVRRYASTPATADDTACSNPT